MSAGEGDSAAVAALASETAARAHFDRWSRSYERSRLLAQLQDRAFEALRLGPSDRFLDVGCGTGALVRRAAALADRAVGVDISPRTVARARELAAGVGGVEFREGSAEALPFADGEFTAVISTTSLHHFADPGLAAREMARVLEPGGRALIGDTARDRLATRLFDLLLKTFERGHVGFFTAAGMGDLLSGAGLDTTAVSPVWAGVYAFAEGVKRGPA